MVVPPQRQDQFFGEIVGIVGLPYGQSLRIKQRIHLGVARHSLGVAAMTARCESRVVGVFHSSIRRLGTSLRAPRLKRKLGVVGGRLNGGGDCCYYRCKS